MLRGIFAVILAGVAPPAAAQERDPPPPETDQPPPRRDAAQVTRDGTFLPTTVAARIGDQRVTGWFTGGYDTTPVSLKSPGGIPLLSMQIEGAISNRVAIHVGLDYEAYSAQARPSAGLRFGLLRQEKNGIDLGIAAQYRSKGFTQSSGEFEFFVAASRRWNRFGLFGNVVYGQGIDPRERDGELRIAALFAAHERVNIGLDANAKLDLGEETPGREAEELEARFDLKAGPMATFAAGPFVFMAQAGVHTMTQVNDRGTHQRTGFLALGGMGASF
jgi:hypothetical protein